MLYSCSNSEKLPEPTKGLLQKPQSIEVSEPRNVRTIPENNVVLLYRDFHSDKSILLYFFFSDQNY